MAKKRVADVLVDTAASVQARWPGLSGSAGSSPGALDAAHNHIEASHRLGLFMLKAVPSGRGDEIIELAKVNLFR